MKLRLLDVNEAAARVGVSERTIRRWHSDGLLTTVGSVGRRCFYRELDVLKAERATRLHAKTRHPKGNVA